MPPKTRTFKPGEWSLFFDACRRVGHPFPAQLQVMIRESGEQTLRSFLASMGVEGALLARDHLDTWLRKQHTRDPQRPVFNYSWLALTDRSWSYEGRFCKHEIDVFLAHTRKLLGVS